MVALPLGSLYENYFEGDNNDWKISVVMEK
jgi:hypothetical protein